MNFAQAMHKLGLELTKPVDDKDLCYGDYFRPESKGKKKHRGDDLAYGDMPPEAGKTSKTKATRREVQK